MRRPAMLVALPLFCLALATCHDTLGPSPRLPREEPVALVTVEDTLVASGDTHISKTTPNQNFGSNDEMRVGGTSRYRALVQFDSAAIRQAVGAGRLDSARVEFTIVANPDGFGTGGRQVDLHRLTWSWTEGGATWNCPVDANTANSVPDCPGTAWDMTNQGQAPYVTTRTARVTVTNGQTGVIRLDVSADVAAFLAGTVHQGWIFRKYNESEGGQALVLSRTTTGAPRLILAVTTNPVPPQAPDTIPAWVYADTNISQGSSHIPGRFVKNVVMVLFKRSASQAERQAAVDAVSGTVVGGRGSWGNGFYVIRVPDPGDGSGLRSATTALRLYPWVLGAFVESFAELDHAKPVDGPGWQDWTLNPSAAGGQNWALEAVAAPSAWGCSVGDSTVPVAVVDAGFQNNPEITRYATLRQGSFSAPSAIRREFHGTVVTSVLAAQGNNNDLMTGVMWRADLRLYDYGSGTPGNLTPFGSPLGPIVEQVANAARDGAKVINLSSGIPGWTEGADPPPTVENVGLVFDWASALSSVLADVRAEGIEPLVVLSAGNKGMDAYWNGFPATKDFDVRTDDQILVVGAAGMPSGTWAVWPKSNKGSLLDVYAPGWTIYALNGFGIVDTASGTSVAAPVSSGIAGLLLAGDPSLDAASLKQRVVLGAVRGGVALAGTPVANAYESLKFAAEYSDSVPLCGNRVWYSSGSVFLDRFPSPEPLLVTTPLAATERVVVEHGGRILSRCNAIWQTCTELFTHTPGQGWTASTNSTSFTSNSAAFRSEFGWSHDGDSAAVIYPGATSASFEIHLESPPGAGPGQTLATVTPATPDFGAVVAWHPARDSLLVGVSTFDPSGNVLATTLRKLSRVTGSLSPPFLTLPSRELYTASVSDDGTQFLIQTRTEPSGPCTIEFRDWTTGNTVLRSVTQPGGVCQNGTKGTFLRAAAQR